MTNPYDNEDGITSNTGENPYDNVIDPEDEPYIHSQAEQDARLDLLELEVDVLQGQMTTAAADINTAEGDIVTLDSRMDTAEGDIDDLEDEVDIDGHDAKATPVDSDQFILQETTAGLKKKTLWSSIKATLKTYFDTLYAPALPVGTQYTQYPTVQSNTISTALPSTESPATLFGGTWAEIKIGGAGSDEEEAVFYRTGGKHLEALETTNRTDGKQTDHMQDWQLGGFSTSNYYGRIEGTGYALSGSANAPYSMVQFNTGHQGSAEKLKALDDGTNGTPRTGKENYPVNRIFKTWEKTSLT